MSVTVKKPKAVIVSVLTCVFLFAGVCLSDTFTNRQTKEQLHGYATGQTEGGQTSVRTQEKGVLKLNLGEWEISRDKLGRNNKVLVMFVENPILYEIETAAFEQAVVAGSDDGPVLILVEIDTPGGRVDFAQRMCAAITKAANCDVVAFIKGGQYGGAISAGAAVALACNKIYMANNTVIGAATLVTDPKNRGKNKEKSYTDVVNEKMSSVWRAYLASLAQQNNRPGLLARAMVDSSIEVIEVNQAAKRMFIEPINKKPDEQIVRTWNKAGSLVTLTAQEAVDCTIADGLAGSREHLLQQLQAGDANVVIDKKTENARREMQIAMRRVEEIRKSFDMKLKQLDYPQPTPKALGIMRGAKGDLEEVGGLAKKYPDLHIDARDIDEMLNSVNAAYQNAIRESKSRR
jgi:membrane-bound ClpP family serine protease